MKQPIQHGYTLLELLIGLTIIGIILSIAFPSFKHLHLRYQRRMLSDSYITAIQSIRYQALALRKNVTLCGSKTGNACNHQWTQGFIIFEDINANGKFESEDTKLEQFTFPSNRQFIILWKSFGNKKQITFKKAGRFFNGSFYLCPKNNDWHYANKLSINILGRLRKNEDKNNNGVIDYFENTNHHCNS